MTDIRTNRKENVGGVFDSGQTFEQSVLYC